MLAIGLELNSRCYQRLALLVNAGLRRKGVNGLRNTGQQGGRLKGLRYLLALGLGEGNTIGLVKHDLTGASAGLRKVLLQVSD